MKNLSLKIFYTDEKKKKNMKIIYQTEYRKLYNTCFIFVIISNAQHYASSFQIILL